MTLRTFLGFLLFVFAGCGEGDAEPGADTTRAREAGPRGEKGDKGDRGDSVFAVAREVIGNAPAAGGVPVSGTVTTAGGRVILTVSGAGYRTAGAGPLGFDVVIDNATVGAVNGFTNEPLSHRAMPVRTMVLETLPAGEHTVRLVPQPDTTVDENDFFNATVVELR
jgi:hypothetical protein